MTETLALLIHDLEDAGMHAHAARIASAEYLREQAAAHLTASTVNTDREVGSLSALTERLMGRPSTSVVPAAISAREAQ